MSEATAQATTPSADASVPSATNPAPAEPSAAPAAPEAKAPEAGKSLVSGEVTPKGEQEPKAADKAPEDIQIKLPEGVKVDEKFMGEFQGIAKELGLKSEAAQKLVDLHLSYVDRLSKEFAEAGTKQADEWYKAVEADPEVGGAKLKDTALTVHKAVQKFGGDEFRKSVDELGLGNWPPLVKFLHKVGSTLKDDSVSGTAQPASTPANDDEAFFKGLYDKTPQMFSR